jgi:predicted phosphodiesterase
MNKPITSKKLAEDLILRFPDTPSLTLARRLYADHPERFPTLNAARHAVRNVRGASGKARRHTATIPRELQLPFNPLGLPDSDEAVWEPFLVEGAKVAGIFGDVHIPYHSISGLTAYLTWLQTRNPDTIIINGDLVDYHSLSRFVKDPKARNLAEERAATLQFFDVLRRMFPKARIIWKLGNHEERQEIYLALKAPELLDLEELEYQNIFKLANYGIELVKDKRIIRLGKLPVIHGHEYPTPVLGPVNAARGLFLRTKETAIVNHHHQVSEHTESTLSGEMITCWSLGCLCELHPAYARLNKWAQGGAVVELDKNGNFEVHNKRILHGTVV